MPGQGSATQASPAHRVNGRLTLRGFIPQEIDEASPA
jgi:hypothetical protein